MSTHKLGGRNFVKIFRGNGNVQVRGVAGGRRGRGGQGDGGRYYLRMFELEFEGLFGVFGDGARESDFPVVVGGEDARAAGERQGPGLPREAGGLSYGE